MGGEIGRVFKIGSQGINSRLEGYYNVERPDGTPEWVVRFTRQFLFPKWPTRTPINPKTHPEIGAP